MPAQLRVFWPDNLPTRQRGQAARKPTLTEFYHQYVLPVIREARGRSAGTLEQDRVALGHWKRITGDPPLDQITPELCAGFMAELAREGKSVATRRKTAIHIQFMLDQSGPPSRRHRSAARLLDEVPYLERPDTFHGEPEPAFTLQEIEALIEACRGVPRTTVIGHADQALWWASLIRFAWHTGLRRGNLLNARWSWMTEDGWLVVPASAYKQNKGGRRFYLSKAALAAARRVRIPGEDRIFAWNGSRSFFRNGWNRLIRALPANRRFGTKAVRRATLTWLAERNPLVSRLVAGHRKLDVLEDYYVQRAVVCDLLESMPIPAGWDVTAGTC